MRPGPLLSVTVFTFLPINFYSFSKFIAHQCQIKTNLIQFLSVTVFKRLEGSYDLTKIWGVRK